MSSSIPSCADRTFPYSDQLVRSHDPLPQEFTEKRESPRLPFRGRAKAIVFPSSQSPPGTGLQDSEVVTSDLSRGGVSIFCRTQLISGQQLMLMLSDKMQLAEVRWCCPLWDGLFVAGCRFLNEPQATKVDHELMAIDIIISSEAAWWPSDAVADQ